MGVAEHHPVDSSADDQYIAGRMWEFDRNKDGVLQPLVALAGAVSILSDLFHDMDSNSNSDGQLNLEELLAKLVVAAQGK